MFLFDRPDESVRVLQAWRDAAELVSVRWAEFVLAEPQTCRSRFAAYIAALDAEEAAAIEIGDLAGLKAT
jgi:hypothetical protein